MVHYVTVNSRSSSRLALVARSLATSYQITKKFGDTSIEESVARNKEYFTNLKRFNILKLSSLTVLLIW